VLTNPVFFHSLRQTAHPSTHSPENQHQTHNTTKGTIMSTIQVGELLYEVTRKITGMTEYGVSFEAFTMLRRSSNKPVFSLPKAPSLPPPGSDW
jgi:hypothetical protein